MNSRKNIVLIGFRCVGKSSLARALKTTLARESFSTDHIIQKRIGNINAFVEKFGWTKFRILETKVVKELSQKVGVIIDTGGGIVEREENMQALKKNGMFFWMKAPQSVFIHRLKNSSRPRLENKLRLEQEIKKKLNQRLPLYQKYADKNLDAMLPLSALLKTVIQYLPKDCAK